MGIGNESNQDNRAISTGKLNALPRLHTRPINVVVYHGSQGRTRFEVGFSLRCLQRLSRPHIATQHCRWRDTPITPGATSPILRGSPSGWLGRGDDIGALRRDRSRRVRGGLAPATVREAKPTRCWQSIRSHDRGTRIVATWGDALAQSPADFQVAVTTC